jgi:hypothetical protein
MTKYIFGARCEHHALFMESSILTIWGGFRPRITGAANSYTLCTVSKDTSSVCGDYARIL